MTLRMGGLASGMDTEALVQAMLEAERIPQIRLENRAYEYEDKLSAWSDMDSRVNSLYSSSSKLVSYSTWQQMKVTPGDSAIVGASADISATTATYDINVDHLAAAHRIASDAQSSPSDELSLTGDFTIGGQPVTVVSTDTLTTIRDKINTAAGDMDTASKVTASIINTSLVITRDTTGETQIDLTDGAEGVLKSLGVLDATEAVKNELTAATDLLAYVDGIEVKNSFNSGLTQIVDGVTMNFKAAGSTTLKVAHDVDSIRSLLEDFISVYNDTMSSAEDHTLVDLGTEGTSIAELGLLQGEQTLNSLQYRSRSILTHQETDPNVLDGAFTSLQEIGIWTSGRENRLAIVDSAKLTEALESNWSDVEDLLRDWDGGIVRKLDDYLEGLVNPIDGTITKRADNLRDSINASWDEIDAMETRILKLEEQLWEKFSRMEETLNRINSQGSFLMAALGASSSSSSSSSSKK